MQCEECKSALRKDKLTRGHWCTVCSFENAHREKLVLRQRVAELEAAQANQADSLQAWSDLWTHINNRLGYADGDLLPNKSNFDYLVRDNWLIQSTEPTIVTPNNCLHCQRSAEKMREAAATLSDEMFADEVADAIRALPLPACDGCNPLAPTVDYTHVKPQSQAALKDQLDELVKIANINGLYDAADFVANRK